MSNESGPATREKRGSGADTFPGRQTPARPIPTRVGVRKPASAALPPALAPKPVEFRWKLVWDESVKALIPVERPQAVGGTAPPESGGADVPHFAMLGRTHKSEPPSGPRSTLTTLALAKEATDATPDAEAATGRMDLSQPSGGTRPWLKWVAGAILVLGLFGGYKYFTAGVSEGPSRQQGSRGRNATGSMLPVGAPIPMTPTGWRGMPAEDETGLSAGRRFSLYRTAAPMADYIVEFTGQVLTKSLGWVVRVADSKNYYALILEQVKSGSLAEVELVRFAVVNGEQGAMKRIPVPAVIRNKPIKVRVDVVGPRITTYVEGRAVDFWNDTRLGTGTFGFMNDKEGRAEIKSVRVSSPGTAAGH
jgi:hypothetical protein